MRQSQLRGEIQKAEQLAVTEMSEEQKTVKKDVQMKLVLDEEVITFSREYTYIYVSFCLVCGNLHTI